MLPFVIRFPDGNKLITAESFGAMMDHINTPKHHLFYNLPRPHPPQSLAQSKIKFGGRSHTWQNKQVPASVM